MSTLLSLSDEILTMILRHIPIKHRMTSCCLASRRLHAVAAAATHDLQVSCRCNDIPRDRADAVLQWIVQHGQHLTSLGMQLTDLAQPLLQLPCPNLLELELWNGRVQLRAAAGGVPGLIQCCTKLTSLELSGIFADLPDGGVIDCLSSLVHLQHLYVEDDNRYICLSGAALPRLSHLTNLSVHGLSTGNLLQLGGLSKLQDLTLVSFRDFVISPSSVPGLAFPASLDELLIMSPLEAALLSEVPTRLQSLFVDRCEVHGPAEGPSSLLSCMAGLQHLTWLGLDPSNAINWPPPGPAYSALMASSHLHTVWLKNTRCPHGIWPYVFPATRKLPHLTSLVLEDTIGLGGALLGPFWGAADISCLVSCCPNLASIETMYLQPGLHVSELYKLTDLTRLHVYYRLFGPDSIDESVLGLARFTQLQYLSLRVSPNLSFGSLLPLTSLTALERLEVQRSTSTDVANQFVAYSTTQVSPFRRENLTAATRLLQGTCRTSYRFYGSLSAQQGSNAALPHSMVFVRHSAAQHGLGTAMPCTAWCFLQSPALIRFFFQLSIEKTASC